MENVKNRQRTTLDGSLAEVKRREAGANN